MDELYEQIVVRNVIYNTICAGAQWFDTYVIDFAVNGAARVTQRVGDGLRWLQTGSVQAYGSVGLAGVVIASLVMLVLLER
jgi:NADH:ubiquinone oxidoreductase subunit 5 (subunit L)/multisubunit Na+/H+ antiporter MnhA subunit